MVFVAAGRVERKAAACVRCCTDCTAMVHCAVDSAVDHQLVGRSVGGGQSVDVWHHGCCDVVPS